MIDKALSLVKKIKKIEFQTKYLINGLIAGSYRSAFKGKGIEFEEVRPYIYGDDYRAIDWNVTARFGTPFIKSFKEERELSILLAIDVSASMQIGKTVTKKDRAAEIAALIAFSAVKNSDNIGLVLFGEEVEIYIPARKGISHVLTIIKKILTHTSAKKGTNLVNLFSFIARVKKRKSICFIISDFLTQLPQKEMAIFSKQHDLIGICIEDTIEIEFPRVDIVHLKDIETNEMVFIDSSSSSFSQEFEIKKIALRNKQKKLFRKAQGDYLQIATEQDYAQALQNYFKSKK
ncbi:hypothetical protein BN1013_00268 [Candidatus Rubidus massiliensis]|nr:hypothetical protein BN1013_00268 [Candidatus Rubidus massiliensis]